MKRGKLNLTLGIGVVLATWFTVACSGLSELSANYELSQDRWLGVYQIPVENQVGIVVVDFNKFGNQIEGVCVFRNETFGFEGKGKLKGQIVDDKFSMGGQLSDAVQGSSVVEIKGNVRGDVMEGSFIQRAPTGEFSGVFFLVRSTSTKYLAKTRKQKVTKTRRTLIDLGVTSPGLLGPGQKDAYGPGIHSDATGRPFVWRTDDGEVVHWNFKENAYGLGVGMDEFGRPVRAKPLW